MEESDFFSEDDFEAVVRQNQQRRIYRRKPKKAADLVTHIVSRRGIAAQKSTQRIQNLWDSVAGMDIANGTLVGSIRRGSLEIIVANSSMLQVLSFQKQQLLQRMQTQMTEIKDLRFRIGRIG